MTKTRGVLMVMMISACGGSDAAPDAALGLDAPGGRFLPRPGTSWQWQISGTIDQTVDAHVFDLDLFDTPQATIDALHQKGKKVICYFDTAYEPNRPESDKLVAFQGDPVAGWPGQYWLDIRQKTVQDIMVARIALAMTKQCDAIEPDDVDVSSNDTKLHITPDEQLSFITLLVRQGHNHELSVALKNDLAQVPDLVDLVDFAVNEECFKFAECDQLAPFIAKGKAVFQTEYTDGVLATKGGEICPGSIAHNFDSLIKHLDLGAERFACR